MILYVGHPDWGKFDIPNCDEWIEQWAPGRHIFRIELVDEGCARLHTVRHTTAANWREDVDPWWRNDDCSTDGGMICTAVYVPTSALPPAVLERMHT